MFLGRTCSVPWPWEHSQSWLPLPSLPYVHPHPAHGPGLHFSPAQGTQTWWRLCWRSAGLQPSWMDFRPSLEPCLQPCLYLRPSLIQTGPLGLTLTLTLFLRLLCLGLSMDPDNSLMSSDPARQHLSHWEGTQLLCPHGAATSAGPCTLRSDLEVKQLEDSTRKPLSKVK